MTSKVKTNILYIASDDDSQQMQEPGPEKAKQPQKETSTKFNIMGSHRLNNNTISQGYFNSHDKNDFDYYYQNPQKNTNPKIPVNTVKLDPRGSKKLMTPSTNYGNLVQTVEKSAIEEQKISPPKQQKQIKKSTKTQRIKTLMFEFDSQQQDDEIQNNQQYIKSNEGQELTQMSIFEVHNKKSETNDDDRQQEQTKIVQITPQCIQRSIDKKQFLISQILRGHILECKVTKKNELTNLLFSQFDMTFRNYLTHVISAKKIMGNLTSNYRISSDSQDFNYSRNKIIGKVRSNKGKQIYNVYDNGYKPDLSRSDNSQTRQILATVRIKTKKGPRTLEVYLLKQGFRYSNLRGFNQKKEINLESLYSIEQNRNNIIFLKTRQPQWVESKRQYFLNFRGRIREASIRNFILQDPKTSQEVLLFGKAANNVYNIDISYPLTPMLGFALVIPQMDRDD